MTNRFSGDLATQSLSEIVRSLFLQHATGVLEVTVDSGKRRLFFIEGELYLPPSNPLALQITKKLAEGAEGAEIDELMSRVAAVIDSWHEGLYTFDPGRAAVPPDAAGPLPTAELVMAAAVHQRDEEGLISRLGGGTARWVARPPDPALLKAARLSAAELALHEHLVEPRSVDEFLAQALDRRKILVRLNRLEALGLIERSIGRPRGEALVDADLLRRFAERVEGDLRAKPVVLDAPAHRATVANLVARLGEVNDYQLLGVATDATTEQVHAAYNELARLVHPSHASRLGFQGRDEALSLLFEKATEAYLVLADPDRRKQYNLEAGIFSSSVADAHNANRSPEFAAKLFVQARDMVQREEYHYAIELLKQALQLDRRADFYLLLAEVQQKNPKWQGRAVDSLREAVNLEPDNLVCRQALAELYEKQGDRHRARAVYRSILARRPNDGDAVRALERLDSRKEKRKGGFLSGIFGGGA